MILILIILLLLVNVYILYNEWTSVVFDWVIFLIYVCSFCVSIYLLIYFI